MTEGEGRRVVPVSGWLACRTWLTPPVIKSTPPLPCLTLLYKKMVCGLTGILAVAVVVIIIIINIITTKISPPPVVTEPTTPAHHYHTTYSENQQLNSTHEQLYSLHRQCAAQTPQLDDTFPLSHHPSIKYPPKDNHTNFVVLDTTLFNTTKNSLPASEWD
ncbi:hypothetical protein BO82DRAFT_47783 [Aspergillus uvarum CBS 121591]|uniref:Uncharacterized protein n=1 Tax=Aspergillus uvarum CBS 121591 TaxID=1448315 RepID=A0A319DV07_9EURO|nr:hypothetical protein BO82DRAFT_47783 [Aspergillus uvarum CBS 121591]PYH82912.1 hypothetical protein BO82DRAFT_47783 [Aspergillus uvarum CBS 121591]